MLSRVPIPKPTPVPFCWAVKCGPSPLKWGVIKPALYFLRLSQTWAPTGQSWMADSFRFLSSQVQGDQWRESEQLPSLLEPFWAPRFPLREAHTMSRPLDPEWGSGSWLNSPTTPAFPLTSLANFHHAVPSARKALHGF